MTTSNLYSACFAVKLPSSWSREGPPAHKSIPKVASGGRFPPRQYWTAALGERPRIIGLLPPRRKPQPWKQAFAPWVNPCSRVPDAARSNAVPEPQWPTAWRRVAQGQAEHWASVGSLSSDRAAGGTPAPKTWSSNR